MPENVWIYGGEEDQVHSIPVRDIPHSAWIVAYAIRKPVLRLFYPHLVNPHQETTIPGCTTPGNNLHRDATAIRIL